MLSRGATAGPRLLDAAMLRLSPSRRAVTAAARSALPRRSALGRTRCEYHAAGASRVAEACEGRARFAPAPAAASCAHADLSRARHATRAAAPRRRGFASGDGAASAIDIQNEARELWNTNLMRVNSRVMGPLEKHSDHMTPMPMVLLLGNHSSGKSTFINHVLQRTVQETGVAPTDDGFTIIAPGSEDVDQDGPALIGDPDLGFTGLRMFGGNLINHVSIKIRTGLNVRDIMVVDSPGMIDSPVPHATDSATRARDRGYDFTQVVRWFAERADVILLFFDPDKPGTTGETLDCMTTSLSGLDHKVHIVLNKVDQFRRVHDFARAYGSLCWNLSKVIPRKDLPRIYTMCIPAEEGGAGRTAMLSEALPDLEAARAEIIEQVAKAPLRRVDNSITRLYDAARLLKMHVTVMDRVRVEMRNLQMKWTLLSGSVLLGAGGLGWGALIAGLWEVGAPAIAVGLAGSTGCYFYGQREVNARAARLTTRDGLYEVFQHTYLVQLAQGDEFIVSLWERVLPHLQTALGTLGIKALPKVSSGDLRGMDEVVDYYVPELRKAATKSGSIVYDHTFAYRDLKQ